MVCPIVPTKPKKNHPFVLRTHPFQLLDLVHPRWILTIICVRKMRFNAPMDNVYQQIWYAIANASAQMALTKDLCINSCQNNGHCPQICIPGPKEPTCQCEGGYESLNNGHQCVDVDECSAENKCSQYCNNTKGSYRCSCSPGYTLEYDQHTCKAANGRPMLIVATNYHAEFLLNSDVASSLLLVQSSLSIKGIAYHDKLSSFYWITAAGVRRSNNGVQSLIFGINDLLPSGLALDKPTGNIYYSAVKNVTRNGQDQSGIRVPAKSLEADGNIITTQSIIPDIALDSLKGLLFWSEHTKPYTGRIVRATMDGRSTMWLYSVDKIMYPTAITFGSNQVAHLLG
uniref:Uncharacterized protein n=1 Tax=Daphnia magna TaxID=35525 RepID=A0A0P4XBG7_9CRUS